MNTYILGVLTQTGIMLIAVLGVSILTGFTGLYSFGHAGFMAVGAYISAVMVKFLGLPIIIGIVCGTIAATLLGLLIGYPTLKLKGDYFLIATLGIGEAIRLGIENFSAIGGAKGMTDVGGGIKFWMVLLIDIAVILLLVNFLRCKHGRNCVAIREEEIAARAMGIDVPKYKVIAMGISCALAGLSGALLGHYMNYLQPTMFNSAKSNELIMMVIMGGIGSLTGSTLAALILVPLPELLRAGSWAEWRMVLYGVTVVFIILFRPGGLMGYKEISISRIINFIKGKVLKGKKKKDGNVNG